jgi:hypothetical protein
LTNIYLEFTSCDIIRIEPISLPFPKTNLDWGRNWIKTNVIVKGGVFSGQFIAEFMTTDLETFKRQLKKLDNDLKASATFEPLEQ